MLPLAEFVLRGRRQALGFVLIALVTSPLLWPNTVLAAAAISLVCLRHGERECTLLWLWALLPCAGMIVYLDSYMPLLLVCAVGITSAVLRKSRSWSYTLMILTACGLVAAVALDSFAAEALTEYVAAYEAFLEDMKQQLSEQQPELSSILPNSIETTFVAGLFGSMLVVSSFVSLALARSWQAKLYNPGGFQQEFHLLRLGKIEVIITVLLTVLIYQLGTQYLTWVWIVLFPLLVAGVALFHAVALRKKLSTHWYVIFYFVLFLWDPLKIVLVGAAIADSLMNIRSKLPTQETNLDK